MGGYMQQSLRFDSVGTTTTRQNIGASTRNYVFFQLTLDQVGTAHALTLDRRERKEAALQARTCRCTGRRAGSQLSWQLLS